MTQNNLGAALTVLGWLESGPMRLEEAVAAYRAALEERTRERAPLEWAINLGQTRHRSTAPRGAAISVHVTGSDFPDRIKNGTSSQRQESI